MKFLCLLPLVLLPTTALACSGSLHIELAEAGVYALDQAAIAAAQPGLADCRSEELRLTQGELARAWRIPAQAVQRDPQGAYVLVVGSDGKVQQKRVELGELRGSDWVVTAGLADGDAVIVAGLPKARPDAAVKALPLQQYEQAGGKTSPPAKS